MAVSVAEILQPQIILQVISRIRRGQTPLGQWLGFHSNRYDSETVSLSGPNTVRGDARNVTYRIFDNARVLAKARAPGTGPATVAPNPIGQAQIDCARFHQKIPLSYEFLSNLSPVVGPNSQLDPTGQDYITRQETFLAIQFNKNVEFLSAAMMRDSCYFIFGGDDIYPSFTAPAGTQVGFQVPFLIPAGNKNQLNMLGGGNIIDQSWANNGANIITHCLAIEAAYAQLSGYSMTDVWINSTMWANIIANTQVRNTAGIANTPFAEFERQPEKGMDGQPTNSYAAVLRGLPTIRWHFCNDVVVQGVTDIDPSYSTAPSTASLGKLVPDNTAIFTTEPSGEWTKMYLGGELVVENPGMPAVRRSGAYFWKEYTTQPSGLDLIGLLNCIPVLYIPKTIAPATVVFP